MSTSTDHARRLCGRDPILVTGANGGIGLAACLELAKRGHRVVGTIRSADAVDAVDAAAEEAGVEVETTTLDLRDAAGAEETIDRIRPGVIVNSAGAAEPGAIEDVADEEIQIQFDTMVFGPMRLARLALPHLRSAEGGGRIINVSSVLGNLPSPLLGWYAAAKQALEAASEALRLEVADDHIAVVILELGGVRTGTFPDARRRLDERIAAGSRYAAAYDVWGDITRRAEAMMSTPEAIGNAIADAVEARHPKARYQVGLDAKVLEGLDKLVPGSIRDTAARRLFHLSSPRA